MKKYRLVLLTLLCSTFLLYNNILEIQASSYNVKLYLGDKLISRSTTIERMDEVLAIVNNYTNKVDELSDNFNMRYDKESDMV